MRPDTGTSVWSAMEEFKLQWSSRIHGQSQPLPVQLERKRDCPARVVVAHVEHSEVGIVSLGDIVFARADRVGRRTLADQVWNRAGQRESGSADGRLAAEDRHTRVGISSEPGVAQCVECFKAKLRIALVVLPWKDVLK